MARSACFFSARLSPVIVALLLSGCATQPPLARKLYIYDSSSRIDKDQAAGRFSEREGVVVLRAGSVGELKALLTALVAKGRTFNRVLFQTHGNDGTIFFNDQSITATTLRSAFTGYRQLFPGRTKVYFDGCNVARGEGGWEFLAAAGEALLKNGGGIALGYTSAGGGVPGWVPLIGGHTVHLWGDLRFIEFGPGALEVSRFSSDAASPEERVEAVEKLESF